MLTLIKLLTVLDAFLPFVMINDCLSCWSVPIATFFLEFFVYNL
jgi:hypothetical protein